MASPSSAKLMMTSIPTRSSVQASDRRDAIFSPLRTSMRGFETAQDFDVFRQKQSAQEAFDVIVCRPAKQFVRSLKDDFPVAKHQKASVRDTHRIAFSLEFDASVSVCSVFRCKRKSIA